MPALRRQREPRRLDPLGRGRSQHRHAFERRLDDHPGRALRRGGQGGLDARHLGGEDIAPPRHGAEQGLRLVAEGAADVADALGDRVVGDEHVRPDRGHDRIAVEQTAGVFHEELQERERFRPEHQLHPVRAQQCAAIGIEGEAVKAVGRAPRFLGVHPPLCSFRPSSRDRI
jgi:hypothetical protein